MSTRPPSGYCCVHTHPCATRTHTFTRGPSTGLAPRPLPRVSQPVGAPALGTDAPLGLGCPPAGAWLRGLPQEDLPGGPVSPFFPVKLRLPEKQMQRCDLRSIRLIGNRKLAEERDGGRPVRGESRPRPGARLRVDVALPPPSRWACLPRSPGPQHPPRPGPGSQPHTHPRRVSCRPSATPTTRSPVTRRAPKATLASRGTRENPETLERT